MKRTLSALALAAGAMLTAATASAAIVVSINPAVQSVAVGNTISVDIRISGLGTEILSAFDLNVLFNPTLAGGGQSVMKTEEFGAGLDDSYFEESSSNGSNGAIGGSWLDDDSLAEIQTDDSFVFLSMSWNALADGALFLNFGANPDFERNVVGRRAETLDAAYRGACVAIGTGTCDNTVPEPGAYALAGIALLGCGWATTRRRREGRRDAT